MIHFHDFTAARLYEAFEDAITTMDELDEMVACLESEQRRHNGRVFAYRGVANADHGFFSSLYRRLWWTDAARGGFAAGMWRSHVPVTGTRGASIVG